MCCASIFKRTGVCYGSIFFKETEVCFVDIFIEIGVFVLVKYLKGQESVFVKFFKRTRVCVFVTLFSSTHI